MKWSALSFSGSLIIAAACGCDGRQVIDPDGSDANRGVTVSNPVTNFSTVASHASSRIADQGFVFVSLAPSTLSDVSRAEVTNKSQSQPSTIVQVVDGGFDPVAISASVGDSLQIVPLDNGKPGDTLLVKVPPRRPPAIVRTRPPKGRIDVALSISVIVVFTEPMKPETINSSSIRLLRNGIPVSGSVTVLNNGWEATFEPSAMLAPNSSYTLLVTDQVADLDGDRLEHELSTSFTTGTTQCDETSTQGEACTLGTTNSVSGTVRQPASASEAPLSSVVLNAFIEQQDHVQALEPITTDAKGNFRYDGLPNSMVHLYATRPGFDQRCASHVSLTGRGTSLDIELITSGTPSVPFKETGASLIGYALELVPDPDRGGILALAIPVPAARLWIESPPGFTVASATTDINGRFAFCNLPQGNAQMLKAAKFGFDAFQTSYSTTGSGTRNRDVFLTRH